MAPADGPARRRRALLVASGSYADPGLAQLRAPTGDVQALAEVLRDGSIGEFDVEQLVDQPTEAIKKRIEHFFSESRLHDLLLLYLSGHGVLSQSRRFYFATATTELQWLMATAIEDRFINDAMASSRARSIVLVLDCCHSGAFGKGLAPKSPLTVDVEHRFEGRGRVTLSASTELEYAFEELDPATGMNELGPAAPGSLFTRCVVEGLRTGEADIDEDGHISVDELYDYVCRRVRERSSHQTPGMAGDVRGDIVIARSGRRGSLPRELVQAIESPLAGVREGAVSELVALSKTAPPGVLKTAREALERLANDDSRRVMLAAEAALGRAPAEPPPEVAPKPEPQLPEVFPEPPPEVPPEPQREPPPAPPPEPPPESPAEAPSGPPPEPPPKPRLAGVWARLSRRGRVIVAAAAAAVVGAVALVLLIMGSGPPPPKEAATPYDFDGDGRQEIVMGAIRGAKAGDGPQSGVVLVHRGPEADSASLFTVASVGLEGRPRPGDNFGSGLASADFDADGQADLAIGTPGRNVISVLYGVEGQLLTGGGRQITADELHPPPEAGWFGYTLLARDLNEDGYADLVVGTPGSPDERGEAAGAIQILFGAEGGVTSDGARRLTPPAGAETGFGSRLRAGDVDADGYVDLVEGAPGEPEDGQQGHGSYCPGSPDGPKRCRALGDAGTSSLAVADVNGDGYADVVQGDANAGGANDLTPGAGAVRLWLGGDNGLRPSPISITQASPGIPGDDEADDAFGHVVEAGDVDGDRLADILVGAPGDRGEAGTVVVIRGAESGHATSGNTRITKGAEPHRFGSTLALLDLAGDPPGGLAVGVEEAPSFADAFVVVTVADSEPAIVPLPGLGDEAAAQGSPLRLGRSAGA
jgi:hypothetical protein